LPQPALLATLIQAYRNPWAKFQILRKLLEIFALSAPLNLLPSLLQRTPGQQAHLVPSVHRRAARAGRGHHGVLLIITNIDTLIDDPAADRDDRLALPEELQ
jgi:hypothetical protein